MSFRATFDLLAALVFSIGLPEDLFEENWEKMPEKQY